MNNRLNTIQYMDSILVDQFLQEQERLHKTVNDKKEQEQRDFDQAEFEAWLIKQHSTTYMQFIELLAEELDDEYVKKATNGVHLTHFVFMVIASLHASAALAIEIGVPTHDIILTALDYFAYALPVAIAALAIGGFIEAGQALFKKEAEDRYFTILEGLNRATLGSIAFSISIGALAANPFVLPGLFFGIVLGMAYKEHRQYQQIEQKITTLNQSKQEDLKELQQLKDTGKTDEQTKIEIQKVEMRIGKTEQTIQMLEAQKDSFRKSRNATLALGLLSISCFVFAAAFPVAAPVLVAVGLLLFVALNRYINHVKTNAKEDAERFKHTLIDKQKHVNPTIQDQGILLAKPGLSAFSVFSRKKEALTTELNRVKQIAAPRLGLSGG